MKGRQVIIGRVLGQEAAALMHDGQLEDLLIDPSDITPLAPGAICRAKVDRLVKGQGGVFLRLPDGARGYLRDRNGLGEGQNLIVQITGVAEEGKAIPVSSRLLLRGRHVIVTPGAPGVNVSRQIRDSDEREGLTAIAAEVLGPAEDAPGLIIRSAAVLADDEDIRDEIAQLAALAREIGEDLSGAPELLLDAPTPAESAWRDWGFPEPDAIEEGEEAFADTGAEDAVLALLSPRVDLGNGAWASVESLRALSAVDVNTGADTSPAAGLKANIALARDLPRQLRLRGIGGQIVIDFAPIPKRDRGTLEQVLRAAFKSESSETVLIGWTAMGLFEINRKRDRVLLSRLAGGAA
ncbi:ribonuclease E/G [Paracoccus aminophilus]|uniref:Ribonuclease G n=1 Tax=Paracoccus aminophilus JCM 7686 TaxID=1367847 RepID=S5XSX1_PARAH|nr:ribonuclease E/G [Paracoccus aminophilus]AGT08237.1 ribonuclease G [Paracoccus aminophilus JCM 7686]